MMNFMMSLWLSWATSWYPMSVMNHIMTHKKRPEVLHDAHGGVMNHIMTHKRRPEVLHDAHGGVMNHIMTSLGTSWTISWRPWASWTTSWHIYGCHEPHHDAPWGLRQEATHWWYLTQKNTNVSLRKHKYIIIFCCELLQNSTAPITAPAWQILPNELDNHSHSKGRAQMWIGNQSCAHSHVVLDLCVSVTQVHIQQSYQRPGS